MKKLHTNAPPYLRGNNSVPRTMLLVIAALLPSALAGCLNFGLHAALVLGVSTGTAVLSEVLAGAVLHRPTAFTDLSAAVTGLLLGMSLPPDIPLWIAAAGSFFAVVVVKQAFGGIGKNIANPAVTARIAMLLVFSTAMTRFRDPLTGTISYATPLAENSRAYWDLFLGTTAGAIGETCAAGLICGGIFLMLTDVISPAVPCSLVGSFALLTFLCGYDVPGQVLSGGLLLGAFFSACDYTTTPMTTRGKVLFGTCCGVLTFFIRHWGGFPEGIPFAILVMNLFTPHIDRVTRTKPIFPAPAEA